MQEERRFVKAPMDEASSEAEWRGRNRREEVKTKGLYRALMAVKQ